MDIGIMLDVGGYGRYGDEKFKKIKEFGYSCVDYGMIDTTKGVYQMPENEAIAFLDNEKRLADEAGIRISQVHGPWVAPKPDTTEEGRNKRFLECQMSIRYTARLGCKYWVIHPLMPYDNDLGTENVLKTWDINVDFYTRLLKTAQEENVVICLENLPFPGVSVSKPDMTYKLVKTINSENFKMCVDVGHVTRFEDLTVGNIVRQYADEIRVFHIHDTIRDHDLHLFPGFGIVDWQDFAAALKEVGFSGVFSLETLPPRKLPDHLFEEMCITLAKIAKEITKDI